MEAVMRLPMLVLFEKAIGWATRSELTKEFLLELEKHADSVVWLQEYCRRQDIREEQLRGALGSFWRETLAATVSTCKRIQ